MTPTIVTKNGEFFLAIGASGGSVIPTATSLVRGRENAEREKLEKEVKMTIFLQTVCLCLFVAS
jgi:gamma-glutamyltranspeptidase